MHLVPFGEYVPAQRLLFFVGPIVEAVSAFVPGTEAVLLPVGDHRASTAICYEVIFASLMRQFVVSGSELLTTITNDAWYGSSSAPYQHWEQAAMRAIENGRYLARAANTGISGFVDPYGRVIEKTTAVHPAAARRRSPLHLTARTIYSASATWSRGLSLAVTVAALLAAARVRYNVAIPLGPVASAAAVNSAFASGSSSRKHTAGVPVVAFQLDEQLRRYQDLARRAGDLRSYL